VIYSSAASPTPITMDVRGATLPAMMVGYDDGVEIKTRISEIPDLGTALRFQLTPVATDPNRVASFSSRGPTTAGALKPDLAAVGTYVYTATEDYLTTSDMYDSSRYIAVNGTSFSSPLVAGAAALLKAARPGLTVAEYRSLLINSATPLPVGESSFAGATDVGSGVLNVDHAVSATILASPTSISFGVGGATLAITRTLTIKNLSSTADTFTIAAVPLDQNPAPSLSTTTVPLDAGAPQEIGLEFNPADLTAGGYQGVFRIQGTRGQVDCTVPYWSRIPIVSYLLTTL
jgi:minor extracellular serine protease Vpr